MAVRLAQFSRDNKEPGHDLGVGPGDRMFHDMFETHGASGDSVWLLPADPFDPETATG